MDINKDSIVNVCGMQSDTKLSKLCEYLEEDTDDIIEGLINNQYVDFSGEFAILCNEDGEIDLVYNIGDEDWILNLLEKVFGEEFLIMVSTRFCYELIEDYDEHVDNEIWGFKLSTTSQDFVESTVSNKERIIKNIITKGHYEDKVGDINGTNLLSKEENIQINLYEENENYERYLDARYCTYFMKKSDFNEDKWWLGWT